MTANKCTACDACLPENARFCARCGTEAQRGRNSHAEAGRRVGWRRSIVVLLVVSTMVFAVVGNVRFVSGTPKIVVPRQYFGFSDVFASIADCTKVPWVVAKAKSGPLCSDLERAGLIESDDEFQRRVERDIEQAQVKIENELDEVIERLDEEMRRDLEKVEQDLERELGGR